MMRQTHEQRLRLVYGVFGLDPAAGGASHSVPDLPRAQAASGAPGDLVAGGDSHGESAPESPFGVES